MSDNEITIIEIPAFPDSPPTPGIRTMSSSPEWFTTPTKAAYRPSPLSRGVALSYIPDGIEPLSSPTESLSSEPSTPPLSPTYSVSSIDMNRSASSASSGSDADSEDLIVTPPPRRPSYSRRNSPSYFNLETPNKEERKMRKHHHRARFASVPVSGLITPMWKIDEDEKKSGLSGLLEPFQGFLPTRRESEPNYILSEDSFVLTHIPAKTVSLSDFKPRLIRVPRWQRPIVIAVMSVLLFGSLCMVSCFQQVLVNAEHAQVIRQGEWMAKHTAMAKAESDMRVDFEPGYRAATPNHHSLKVQSKLANRHKRAAEEGAAQVPFGKVPFKMTKDEELAALMNFIVGTAANTLPPIDTEDATSLEAFLPFDPRSPHARAEIDDLVATQWEHNPIMVLGNMRDPKMREIRGLLKKYTIKPEPFYVDVDQRSDSTYLSATLDRLIGKQDGPFVLFKGKNIGSAPKLVELEKKETLIETVSGAGASIAKKLKKNKHQKEEERKENERVLGPKPIDLV
ncbi:hypothetical protein CI109_102405 [Kwoniella shandongensis]|uniref:Uncharacterized protein n=1 Tax=Kwoniella shandongensis TaxID=1734106 RepID=A0A5M6BZR8_9TREE|nr:uncharacterized protein CI109_003276 [Kwoniella shandongensis]KAA5528376.1 hypothetical protein CI109_003276 [Kwoniella shandongensis]